MKIKAKLQYWQILINAKLNKKIQSKYVYVPEEMNTLILNKFSDFWVTKHVKNVIILINTSMAKINKEVYFEIVKYLTKEGKNITIREEVNIFNNEDIKILANINRKIILDNRYIEKSKIIGKNQILSCDINSYILVLEKLEYFKKKCNEACNTEFEKVVFTIVQIADYMKYAKTNIYNSCLVNSLLLRYGVCVDFVTAMWKCLTDIGVKSENVQGIGSKNNKTINVITNVDHIWNQVRIDNIWYNMDVTWFNTAHTDDFLLVSDKSFYKNGLHVSNNATHDCKVDYDRNILKDKIKEYRKRKNIFIEYDEGIDIKKFKNN